MFQFIDNHDCALQFGSNFVYLRIIMTKRIYNQAPVCFNSFFFLPGDIAANCGPQIVISWPLF